MLEWIRRSAESWGVKVLFGLIIIVFVFWGVGSMDGQQSSVVAYVNDQPIGFNVFQEALQNQLNQVRQRNPTVTLEELNKMGFKQQVLEQLVTEQLLLNEARKLNITASQVEVIKEISGIPAFQDANGKFDKDAYRNILRGQRMTAGNFEHDVMLSILQQKIQNYAALPAMSDEAEAKAVFDFAGEQRRIEYIQVAAADFTGDITPTEEEIKAAYTKDKENYKLQPRVRISYIKLTPEALADKVKVTDEEIKAYYDSTSSDYAVPEQAKASHILIKVEEDADEKTVSEAKTRIEAIARLIENGLTFEKAATNYSEGPSSAKAGDLGWVKRGMMVGPFEEAVFASDTGKVSEPVRTKFGWHLVLVKERKQATQKTLEEVKDTITATLAKEKATDILQDEVDQALEAVIMGDKLEKVATKLNLKLDKSELFSKEQATSLFGFKPSALELLFSMKKDDVTDSPLNIQNGYILAEVLETKPAEYEPMEAVKDKIIEKIKQEKAMELAKKKADELLKTVTSTGLPEAEQANVSTTKAFNRQGFIEEIGFQAKLAKAAFAAKVNAWLPQTYATDTGYVIARLIEKAPPSEDQWNTEKAQWVNFLTQGKQQEMLQAFVMNLRSMADIEIVNTKVLQ